MSLVPIRVEDFVRDHVQRLVFVAQRPLGILECHRVPVDREYDVDVRADEIPAKKLFNEDWSAEKE